MNGVVPNITDEETSTTIGDSTIALPSHTCHYANQNGTDMNECKASESISPCYKSCKVIPLASNLEYFLLTPLAVTNYANHCVLI